MEGWTYGDNAIWRRAQMEHLDEYDIVWAWNYE